MPKKPSDPPSNRSEDRPLECSECKKSIAVRYTEVVGNAMIHTVMCADCPHLEHRLHGIPARKEVDPHGPEAGLCCGSCGTTLQAVKTGSLLGCAECYAVFGDVLLGELVSMGKISSRLATARKTTPVHIGRVSGEVKEMKPAVRLLALNEALNETLQREDYEQAAWLRDQIKQITEIIDE